MYLVLNQEVTVGVAGGFPRPQGGSHCPTAGQAHRQWLEQLSWRRPRLVTGTIGEPWAKWVAGVVHLWNLDSTGEGHFSF